jgi:nucleotide-binding universal stress UspA family protein
VVIDYRLSWAQAHDGSKTGVRSSDKAPSLGSLADRLAEKAARALEGDHRKVSWVVREGDPRRELIRECVRFKASSLFLGSRGLNGLQRFFLGNVSLALAERAPCTVEVVRP